MKDCSNLSRTLLVRAGMVRPRKLLRESEQQRGAKIHSLGEFLRS